MRATKGAKIAHHDGQTNEEEKFSVIFDYAVLADFVANCCRCCCNFRGYRVVPALDSSLVACKTKSKKSSETLWKHRDLILCCILVVKVNK
jgi:hypothetical protein